MEEGNVRREPLRFASLLALFFFGLAAVVAAGELALGWYNARTYGARLIGREVYLAKRAAALREAKVSTLYIGDSVGRQLFPIGAVDAATRSFAANQAISLAGQFYLLRDALATHENVERVYLFYTPGGFDNDLDQSYTADYYFGFFHSPRQVLETFAATGRWDALTAHLRRMALPNLSAVNSWLNRRGAGEEPDTDYLAVREQRIVVSHVSEIYLRKIRELCDERGITFRVYSPPVSDRFTYTGGDNLYDAPLLYLSAEEFLPDAVHLQPKYLDGARASLLRHIGLDGATSQASR